MNKDQVEGSVKKVAGKAQQKMGEIIGNPMQQVKGAQKQVEGNIQKSAGNAKEIIKDATKHR